MKISFARLLLLAATIASVASCGSYKRTVYLQDMDTNTTYLVGPRADTKIRQDDILNISVSCKSPALAAPFNVLTGTQVVNPINGETSFKTDLEKPQGYLVDKNGNINFPVLGMLHVEGMTLPELREWISKLIIKGDYIKDPIVNAEFVNFQFTVLGEIQSGNYTVNSGSVNIFEALAMARDLSDNAQRKDVWVIRTEGGTRRVYSLDLTSKSCYESPAFYLQQNDMVYVKPYKTKADAKVETFLRWYSLPLNLFSTAASILLLFKLW